MFFHIRVFVVIAIFASWGVLKQKVVRVLAHQTQDGVQHLLALLPCGVYMRPYLPSLRRGVRRVRNIASKTARTEPEKQGSHCQANRAHQVRE